MQRVLPPRWICVKKNYLYCAADGQFFHLHPELVDSRAGEEYTHFCKKCYGSLSKGSIPKLSLARGLDFGNTKRLGLAEPNLHEQIILSRCRLFQATMKVSFGKGQCMCCHAIPFFHETPEIASYLLNSEQMFAPETLANSKSCT